MNLLDELGELTDKLDQFGEEKFFIEINEGLIGILELWLNIRIYFDFFIILFENETQTGFEIVSIELLFEYSVGRYRWYRLDSFVWWEGKESWREGSVYQGS